VFRCPVTAGTGAVARAAAVAAMTAMPAGGEHVTPSVNPESPRCPTHKWAKAFKQLARAHGYREDLLFKKLRVEGRACFLAGLNGRGERPFIAVVDDESTEGGRFRYYRLTQAALERALGHSVNQAS
jgi:hypothetical protein